MSLFKKIHPGKIAADVAVDVASAVAPALAPAIPAAVRTAAVSVIELVFEPYALKCGQGLVLDLADLRRLKASLIEALSK
jgi:hypothetical protein